ncbi:PhzF family phenazine biosynthesis protein [Oricola cellulosilytica]|nr:PhzF family phenazine biosynthesis protein [Oricola cellulosilytica]
MQRSYAVYDVFTERALAGNPLAIVFDAEGLETDAMQAIAREFNLSETVFVQPPEQEAQTARIRIFMPGGELPFAGHPTVGTAVALAERNGIGDALDQIIILRETIGNIRCAVRTEGESGYAEFDLPRLPEPHPCELDPAAVAEALRLNPQDIGFENHTISAWTAGKPYFCVPVRGLDAAARAQMNAQRWTALFEETDPLKIDCPYVYCRETVHHECAFHARMFAPHHGIPEDPATGSAVAALAGAISHFDGLSDGPVALPIEQGIEMGRPSFMRLEIEAAGGEIRSARIGGAAVKVAEGTLYA